MYERKRHRYYSVCADYREGRVTGKNLKNKQKAIFLDRDGTIKELKEIISIQISFFLVQ